MPKVSSEYVENKRNEILDAAYRVCMNKPLHEVSMRDIILESKLSQGGIYRYYSNIDEIFISLINQRSTFYDVEPSIDLILAQGDCPEKIVAELFLLWKKVFLDNLMGVGKIYYELSTLYANQPDKLAHFIASNTLSREQSKFEQMSIGYVISNIQTGYFTPKIPQEDIIKLLITSFDGIIRDLILRDYSNMKEQFPIIADLDGFGLVYSLCVSFILLLGGNETEIDRGRFDEGEGVANGQNNE